MNKTWIIGGIIAVLIALGLWFAMKSAPAPEGATQLASQETGGQPVNGSLASLVARGGTVQCDVGMATGPADENGATKGSVYVSGGKMRGDFEMTSQAGTIESHMIRDGEYIYVWSSAMPMGMKMKATAAEQPSSPTAQPSPSDIYAQNHNYNCKPWSGDSSKFELPAGVTFNDMSAMMPGANAGASGSVKAGTKMPAGANCAMCDQAPDAASKAQCKTAMGCK